MRIMKVVASGLFVAVFLFSCRDKYEPDIEAVTTSYLVVEGTLNTNGPTNIRLSRSTQLDTFVVRPVTFAQLIVEGRDNSTRNLLNAGGGNYRFPNLNLTVGTEYRLRILDGGLEYVSEYVKAVATPQIDSITWKLDGDGLTIMANTHDPSGNTRYYRWEYEETWEVRSYYSSRYKYMGNGVVRERISPAEDVYVGWKYGNSTNILIGSSAKLDADIISQAPLIQIPLNDERPAVRYSVLVRQYALDQKGYEFYQLMKKNTESLGTIFDPQPTDIRGNITCVTDPGVPVIGYIYASSVVEQRKFISSNEIPSWRYPQFCPTTEVVNHPDSLRLAYDGGSVEPYEGKSSETNPDIIVAYYSSSAACVDVTRRNASLVRPVYW